MIAASPSSARRQIADVSETIHTVRPARIQTLVRRPRPAPWASRARSRRDERHHRRQARRGTWLGDDHGSSPTLLRIAAKPPIPYPRGDRLKQRWRGVRGPLRLVGSFAARAVVSANGGKRVGGLATTAHRATAKDMRSLIAAKRPMLTPGPSGSSGAGPMYEHQRGERRSPSLSRFFNRRPAR
jgi:hypothetical protein